MKELILLVQAGGKSPAVRYMIFNSVDNTWWDGKSFQNGDDRAVRYATQRAAQKDLLLLLKDHYGHLPRARFVVPVEIDVYGNVSESNLVRFMYHASELKIAAEKLGNGPGRSLVVPKVKWGELRRKSLASVGETDLSDAIEKPSND